MKIYRNIEQGSQEWLDLKCGKITGTRVAKVFKSSNLDLLDQLIAEIESNQIKYVPVNYAMQRGIDLEPLALKEYEETENVTVESVGFVQSKYDWLGISPDALLFHEGKPVKGVEVKCTDSSKHIKHIRQNKLPNDYRHQVYTYFLCMPTIQEVDFVSYDPRIQFKPMHTVTVHRSDIETELTETMNELIKFWAKVQKYHLQITF